MKRNILFSLISVCFLLLISCTDDKVDNPMENTEWIETSNVESFQFSDKLVSVVVNGKTVYILNYTYDNGKIFAKGGKNDKEKEIYFTAEIKRGDKYGLDTGSEYLLIVENGVSKIAITKEKYYKK